ncbi:MAG: M23 family metallopeptidase [Calditrichia bacterium]
MKPVFPLIIILAAVLFFACHVSYRQTPRAGDIQELDLVFPVKGKKQDNIISVFGDNRQHGRRLHNGIDIAVPAGTQVLAPQNGKIVLKSTGRSAGNYLWLLDYRGGYLYEFLHLADFAAGIEKGSTVKQGQVIGYVGKTGNARNTVPHLHFSIARLFEAGKVNRHKRYLDPLLFLR